jgi:3D (Asp-Asp-Asp) domain-containing protein
MTGFEASESVQPQDDNMYEKTENKKAGNFIWAVVIMFLVVVFLCVNNYILLGSYKQMQSDLVSAYEVIKDEIKERQELVGADTVLNEKLRSLSDANRKLKEDYGKASRGSNDLGMQLDALKKQNSELSKQNKNLTDDNVALQNSLKTAASAGVKPQNYSLFDGLNARNTINRGKYIGKFLGTAYTPSKEECGNDKGITKSGKAIMPGVSIAIDNRYWPFGTVFYIKGLGYTVAMDTGSAIKGKYRFDFSVFDKDFAKLLGSRKWEVYLVKLGKGDVSNIKL